MLSSQKVDLAPMHPAIGIGAMLIFSILAGCVIFTGLYRRKILFTAVLGLKVANSGLTIPSSPAGMKQSYFSGSDYQTPTKLTQASVPDTSPSLGRWEPQSPNLTSAGHQSKLVTWWTAVHARFPDLDVTFLICLSVLSMLRFIQTLIGLLGHFVAFERLNLAAFSLFALTKSLILVIWARSLSSISKGSSSNFGSAYVVSSIWANVYLARIFLAIYALFIVFIIAATTFFFGKFDEESFSFSAWYFITISLSGMVVFVAMGMTLSSTVQRLYDSIRRPSSHSDANSQPFLSPPIMLQPVQHKPKRSSRRRSTVSLTGQRIIIAASAYGASFAVRAAMDITFFYTARDGDAFLLVQAYNFIACLDVVCEAIPSFIVLGVMRSSLKQLGEQRRRAIGQI